jgi:hypothetical protein
MRVRRKGLLAVGALALAAAMSVATVSSASAADKRDELRFNLTPSSAQIAQCIPHAKVTVEVDLQTDKTGRDVFEINASGMPANTAFTVFLLETPVAPFGAAEYIGDFTTDKQGKAHQSLKLIVQEAFSFTLVNGQRVRVDLNHVGVWFADPAGDDFCFGKGGGPVTPFDGDGSAGVQVLNTAPFLPNAPLPAP